MGLTLLVLKLVYIHHKWVNTVAADALAPCVARPLAAMILIVQYNTVLVFHKEGLNIDFPNIAGS